MDRLATEIWDHIFDEVRGINNDRAGLCAAARVLEVCKSWHTRAEQMLYRRILVTSTEQAALLEPRLLGECDYGERSPGKWTTELDVATLEPLPHLLPLLPTLRSLSHRGPEPYLETVRNFLVSTCPARLLRLEIYVGCNASQGFSRFSQLSTLQELDLTMTAMSSFRVRQDTAGPHPSPGIHLPSLRRLRCAVHRRPVVPCLKALAPCTFPALEHLALDLLSMRAGEDDTLLPFLRAHSAHLRRLDLNVWDEFMPAVLGLAYPRLEHLSFPEILDIPPSAGALIPPSVRTLSIWSSADGEDVWTVLAGIAKVDTLALRKICVSSESPLRDISTGITSEPTVDADRLDLARRIEKRAVHVEDAFGKAIKLISE